MGFKFNIIDDINKIFMNPDEFGELANIDGKEIIIVPDNDLLEKLKSSNQEDGLAESEILFHTSASNFTEKPFVDDIIHFNRKIYTISDVKESKGMYSITIAGNHS